MSTNPYARYLDHTEALDALSQSTDRLRLLISSWPAEKFARSLAPGKWTAAQLMLHLAHVELAFATRVRMALSTPDYVVQPFEQDDWMRHEPPPDPDIAARAFFSLRELNLRLFRSLTRDARDRQFKHPERGDITVQWVIELLAGHDRHHLGQLREIDKM